MWINTAVIITSLKANVLYIDVSWTTRTLNLANLTSQGIPVPTNNLEYIFKYS